MSFPCSSAAIMSGLSYHGEFSALVKSRPPCNFSDPEVKLESWLYRAAQMPGLLYR